MLRDVEYLSSSMPADWSFMGRSVAQMWAECGGSLSGLSSRHQEQRALQISRDENQGSCTLDLSGLQNRTRLNFQDDHVFRVMRRRIKKGSFEFQHLTYRVPEADWPYIADIVKASAESFQVVW